MHLMHLIARWCTCAVWRKVMDVLRIAAHAHCASVAGWVGPAVFDDGQRRQPILNRHARAHACYYNNGNYNEIKLV